MRLSTCAFTLLLVALAVQASHSQITTGTISGTLKDSSGAVLPGATITLLNEDTGISRIVQSDSSGRYVAPSLSLGRYRVTATLEGFQTEARSGIELTLGREAVVNFDLQVGAVSQTLEVTGEAPLVETTSATVSGLVDMEKIRDLPLNGRSYEQLALLQPGVIQAASSTGGGIASEGKKMSISGAKYYSNSFLLDGTSVVNIENITPGSQSGQMLGVEAIREFKVITNPFSAEYGRGSGGVISSVTRSGTNTFHGSVFEFLRNDNLDARNFFDGASAPEFKRNQFGFSFGGPIVRNRTFFFGTYEGLRQGLGITGIDVVPNEPARRGFLPDRTGALVNVGVATGIAPILALFPVQNGRELGSGLAEYSRAYTETRSENFYQGRVDHQVSSKDSVFVRYTISDAHRTTPETREIIETVTSNRYQYVTLQWTRIVSPTLLMVSRFGFNRSLDIATQVAARPEVETVLSLIPNAPSFGGVDISGLGTLGRTGSSVRVFAYNVPQWSFEMTSLRGKHSLKAGLNIDRLQNNQLSGSSSSLGGSLSFGSLENILRGIPRTFGVDLSGPYRPEYHRQTYFGLYLQDDVKMRSNLSVNLGLRYEFTTIPKEKNGEASTIADPWNDKAFTVGAIFTRNVSLRSFGPRVGFAWDPTGQGRTSVRGGLGVFYDQLVPAYYKNRIRNSPFDVSYSIDNPPWPNYYQTALVTGRGASGVIRFTHFTATPYTMQYSLSVERQIARDTVLTAGYAGSRGVHLVDFSNPNIAEPQIQSDGRKFFAAGLSRRNPSFGEMRMSASEGNSFYNALRLGLSKKLSRGLQVQTSYQLSKNIADVDEFGSSFGTRPGRMDPDNHASNRGMSNTDARHNLVFNYTYDLPFGPGRTLSANLQGWTAKLVGGWQVNGITTISSGQPFSVTIDFNRSRNLTVRDVVERPNLVAGRTRDDIVRPGNPDEYFDPLAFELSDPGYYGNLGFNHLVGPGMVNVDFGLVREIPVKEDVNIQFRAEVFNMFNRANFWNPTDNVLFNSSGRVGGAGRIRQTTTKSRNIQFGVKIVF